MSIRGVSDSDHAHGSASVDDVRRERASLSGRNSQRGTLGDAGIAPVGGTGVHTPPMQGTAEKECALLADRVCQARDLMRSSDGCDDAKRARGQPHAAASNPCDAHVKVCARDEAGAWHDVRGHGHASALDDSSAVDVSGDGADRHDTHVSLYDFLEVRCPVRYLLLAMYVA
jgi:hypothetical protein